jgi:hypothetical protein
MQLRNFLLFTDLFNYLLTLLSIIIIYYNETENVDIPAEDSICGVDHWDQISSSDAT